MITLPHGVWVDGERRQEAELRVPTGIDEAFLLDDAFDLSPAEQATALLARCLERLGRSHYVDAEAVRSLTAGDREALLLHLHHLTFGDRLQCVLDCPECGEMLDVELDVAELLVAPYPDPRECYETTTGGGESAYRAWFRLPTGADLEAAACVGADAGAELLLERCVEEVERAGHSVDGVPAAVAEHVPDLMEELDPQAELRLALSCPSCGGLFDSVLDAGALVLTELAERGRQLYHDVHALARHYGWSEAEILSLPRRKRRLYLDLLAEELPA